MKLRVACKVLKGILEEGRVYRDQTRRRAFVKYGSTAWARAANLLNWMRRKGEDA